MSNYDHWMKLHIGDYLADTQHLTTFQHGAYLLLIMHYFKRRGLPTDERELARIARCSMTIWRRWAGPVMALFAIKKGVWQHTKIDALLDEARSISEKRQAAGKKGASTRWGMANAIKRDGKSHSPARPRARDSTTTTKSQKNPPRSPPANGGASAGANFRNGFGESVSADMEESKHANTRPRGAAVVSIAGRAHRREH